MKRSRRETNLANLSKRELLENRLQIAVPKPGENIENTNKPSVPSSRSPEAMLALSVMEAAFVPTSGGMWAQSKSTSRIFMQYGECQKRATCGMPC